MYATLTSRVKSGSVGVYEPEEEGRGGSANVTLLRRTLSPKPQSWNSASRWL